MDRRGFIQSVGTVPAAQLVSASGAVAQQNDRAQRSRHFQSGNWFDPCRTWHFFDLWHFDHVDGLRLCQGAPEYQEDATFVAPPIGTLSAWPTVYRDEASDSWRMLYSADWKPYQLMVARSDDGRQWQPFDCPDIAVSGGKLAEHHIFSLPGGSGGGVYVDPGATDGSRFKVFAHRQGKPAYEHAAGDPDHIWHDLAKRVGPQRYINDEFVVVSNDGLHWEPRLDMRWSSKDWHPEPPIFAYYNRHLEQHCITVRPGWGDRRQCLLTTENFRSWYGPHLALQPGFDDEELFEFYGMPVFPYGDGYAGFLWVFHCESAQPTRGFNRFVGSVDCHLALSHDGIRFDRTRRGPFIGTGEPNSPMSGAIQPSCMVETESELRIYSSASRVHHGMGSDARRRGLQNVASITLHTLRKDGLTYLNTVGDYGRCITKPIVLLEPEFSVNVAAPHGEFHVQLTDLESRPIEGFTFEDCIPLSGRDEVDWRVRWKGGESSSPDGTSKPVIGKMIRLEFRLRDASVYAIRGHFHFIDAQDRALLVDGESNLGRPVSPG